jgi:hypothetical protein
MSELMRITVDPNGITKLIQNFALSTRPQQYVREFIKNSVEAIQKVKKLRPGYKGKINVDVNWLFFVTTGKFKISFIDNGIGMSPDEMRENLNQLSKTGGENLHENYGVGGKISAITRNHAGIVYDSWKDGKGSRIVLHYNEDKKEYGAKELYSKDGNTYFVQSLKDDEEKPDIIKESGTRVTLLGMQFNDDTMKPPEGVRGGKSWLLQYANTKFYNIPNDIKLDVSVDYDVLDDQGQKHKRHNFLRTVTGQKAILDNNAEQKGTVDLIDAKVHWWILKSDRKPSGRELLLGHTGCVNEDETFEIGIGNASKAQKFGIWLGKEDVVLYVEPDKGQYKQTICRTKLSSLDGNDLPWARWEDEFAGKLPPEIKTFIKKRSENTTGADDKSIRERLKDVQRFFHLSRYRANPKGIFNADPDSEVMSLTGSGDGTGNSSRKRPKHSSGRIDEFLMAGLKIDGSGIMAEETKPDKFPQVTWVSLERGERSPDEMEDRAASYLSRENMIKANEDFNGYTDIVEDFVKQYSGCGKENYQTKIVQAVKDAYSQQWMECIMGINGLRNRTKWDESNIEDAYSEVSLTVAVLPKYHLVNRIKRDIGNALGKAERQKSQENALEEA